MLEIKPLSFISFANIFSHSVGHLFALFIVSFAVQELVGLIRSICSFLFLFLLPWETDLKKQCYMSENVLPIISSRSLMAPFFIFHPLLENKVEKFFHGCGGDG